MTVQILVCGDRNWDDWDTLDRTLGGWKQRLGLQGDIMEIIEGEARGADQMSYVWANNNGVAVHPYPADWKLYGKAAGPIRNRQMLSAKPDYVLAFHNDLQSSKGTANMVKIARKAGIPTYVYRSERGS